MTSDNVAEVSRLMQAYFDGLYHADSTRLRDVFHPRLSYICATDGDEMYLDLDTYMSRIDQREPPAKHAEPRHDAILEIAFASTRLARVTARMTMMGRDYIDCLTLVRHGPAWRIVTKVFAYTPQEG